MDPGATFCGNCGREVKGQPRVASQHPEGETQQSTPPWSNGVLLQRHETVTRYWGANVYSSLSERGYLLLTNQRIIFAQERGLVSKSYVIKVSIPLESLTGLALGGVIGMKYVSLAWGGVERAFRLDGVSKDREFAIFKSLVEEQRNNRYRLIEAENAKGRMQVVLDFAFLRDYMAKGGLSLQVVKCPQCGAPLSLPKEGNQAKCDHCGATVFAQDIMDKVKQLIG